MFILRTTDAYQKHIKEKHKPSRWRTQFAVNTDVVVYICRICRRLYITQVLYHSVFLVTISVRCTAALSIKQTVKDLTDDNRLI